MVEFVEEGSEAVVQEELIANERPIGDGARCPFFLQLYYSKIKQFENGIVIRKCAALSHLAKTEIYRLNRIYRVHYLANRRRIVKKLFDVGKASLPDGNRAGIFRPDPAQTLKLDSASFKARCAIDFFQMRREVLIILGRDVL